MKKEKTVKEIGDNAERDFEFVKRCIESCVDYKQVCESITNIIFNFQKLYQNHSDMTRDLLIMKHEKRLSILGETLKKLRRNNSNVK